MSATLVRLPDGGYTTADRRWEIKRNTDPHLLNHWRVTDTRPTGLAALVPNLAEVIAFIREVADDEAGLP